MTPGFAENLMQRYKNEKICFYIDSLVIDEGPFRCT